MMKNQIALFVVAAVGVFAFACTEPTREPDPQGQTEQSVEGVCAHPICQTGGPLVATCNTCATSLCALDPYCCQVSWDATCVGEVASICGQSCTAPPPPPPPTDAGASTCSHPICTPGASLTVGCDPCVTKLCAQDAYCCSTEWDTTCVGEVISICKQVCQ